MYEGYGVYREILNLIDGVDETLQAQTKTKVDLFIFNIDSQAVTLKAVIKNCDDTNTKRCLSFPILYQFNFIQMELTKT